MFCKYNKQEQQEQQPRIMTIRMRGKKRENQNELFYLKTTTPMKIKYCLFIQIIFHMESNVSTSAKAKKLKEN